MLNEVHHNFRIIDLCTSYHYFTMVNAVRIHIQYGHIATLVSLCKLSPLQKQRAVHCRQAFLQRVMSSAALLQPQCMSFLQACVASGRVIQHISQPPSAVFFQPHSLRDGSSGAAIIIWAQQ